MHKARRIGSGEWVKGYLFQSEKESWITDSININLSTHRNFAWWQVIPETVCRPTYLTDKLSIDIYEHDILDDGSEVLWEDGGFVVYPPYKQVSNRFNQARASRQEVVGNSR